MSNKKTTKNAKGGGTIRKRKDGRWEGRVTVGFDSATGKQIQKSVYGKTQQEARKQMAKIVSDVDEDDYFDPEKIRLSDWLNTWLEEYCGDKKYLTVKGYRAKVNTHINPVLGHYYLHQLTPAIIQRFYNGLMNPSDGSKGICAKSVKNTHGILSKALNQAISLGYLRSNPCRLVTLPRVEKFEIEPLDDDQVAMLLNLAEEDEIFGILLKVIVLTGMRLSEAIGLTWDCVDFRRGTVLINKQLQKRPESAGGFVFSSAKNGKGRTLRPAPYVMALLQTRYDQQVHHKDVAQEAWAGWHTESEHKKALVFTNLFGEHLHPQTVYNHFKKLADRIGAPNARVHDLRHTFAVLSIQNGDDYKTVQVNLGHATAAFTLDVYGHVSEAMKSASAERMEKYIQSLSNL